MRIAHLGDCLVNPIVVWVPEHLQEHRRGIDEHVAQSVLASLDDAHLNVWIL
jgi:hypothetical protein